MKIIYTDSPSKEGISSKSRRHLPYISHQRLVWYYLFPFLVDILDSVLIVLFLSMDGHHLDRSYDLLDVWLDQ